MAKSIKQAAEQEERIVVAEVHRAGEAIMIPDTITIAEAIETLVNKQTEEEQVVGLSENFDAFIWEGCYALANALDKKYGWFRGMSIPETFFEPKVPPSFQTVKTSPTETVQVPWGRFLLPGIPLCDGFMATSYYRDSHGMVCFKLSAEIRRKHARLFHELCKEVHAQLKERSLYKGKAVTIKFRDSGGDPIEFPEPTFPAISKIEGNEIIFSRHIEDALLANLYTPLTKTALVRAAKIPLKRGVLLAGPYGTGKTLVATCAASRAVENGWTFLFCQSAADFSDCVRFAQKYQPAVVFCEDIDRVTDGERDQKMDEILNVIDGVDSKLSEIMLVLTTNEVESIHPGMLRNGRLDAVIAIERPDAEAVGRLIRHYSGDLLDQDSELMEVGAMLSGSTPSVIREVVERAKLTAVAQGADELRLNEQALLSSARTMRTQLDLLNRKPKQDPNPMEVFGKVLAKHLIHGAQMANLHAPEVEHMLLPNGAAAE